MALVLMMLLVGILFFIFLGDLIYLFALTPLKLTLVTDHLVELDLCNFLKRKNLKFKVFTHDQDAHSLWLSVNTHLFGRVFVAHRRLWESWTLEERQIILLWSEIANRRSGIFRFLISPPVMAFDRDCVLYSRDPLVLLQALQKNQAEQDLRARQSLDVANLWAGLGLSGPSWLGSWPTLDQRKLLLLKTLQTTQN